MRPRKEYVWVIVGFFVGVAFISGFSAGYFQHGLRVRVETHTVVKSPYGKPDGTVDGAQLNAQLAGEKCDVYQAKRTVVCHP